MNRTTLILTDLVFVIVLLLACNNEDLNISGDSVANYDRSFCNLCIRHINYYNMTRKIY